MAEPLIDRMMGSIREAGRLYHRLILLVSPAGTGKTMALRQIQERLSVPLINVNLELSQRMLSLSERQQTLELPRLLAEVVNASGSDPVLLDNIEILFDVSLKQNPLRLLQAMSRNKTVVATWNGYINGEQVVYATPDHPEYRQYPVRDFLAVSRDDVA